MKSALAAVACALLPACAPSPVVIGSSAPWSSAATPVVRADAAVEVALTIDDLPLHGPGYPGLDRVALGARFTDVFRAQWPGATACARTSASSASASPR